MHGPPALTLPSERGAAARGEERPQPRGARQGRGPGRRRAAQGEGAVDAAAVLDEDLPVGRGLARLAVGGDERARRLSAGRYSSSATRMSPATAQRRRIARQVDEGEAERRLHAHLTEAGAPVSRPREPEVALLPCPLRAQVALGRHLPRGGATREQPGRIPHGACGSNYRGSHWAEPHFPCQSP